MAERAGGRWSEEVRSGDGTVGHHLVVTRRGIEVSGWYYSTGTGEPISLSWEEFEEIKDRVMRGKPTP